MATRCVNIGFISRQRAKQVVKAGRQIAQTRAQIQNVWRREYCDASRLQNPINFPDDLPIVFQVLDCLDAGNQREPIIIVRKRLPIQIDCIDHGAGTGEQFIRVIAAKTTERIMRSNQPQQFPGPAANIEMVATRWRRRRGRNRAKDRLMNPRGT